MRGGLPAALSIGMGCFLILLAAGPAAAAVDPVPPLRATPQPPAGPLGEAECPPARELCIQAEDQGEFDVRTGTAELSGNVRGYMRSRRLTFAAQSLKAQRLSGKRTWRRLELNGAVGITQPGRRIAADHAVFEPNVATMYGKVRMDEEGRWLEGDELVVEHEPQRVTMKGTPSQPLAIFVADADAEASSGRLGDGTQVKAQRAVLEEHGRQLSLSGAVRVVSAARQLTIEAESVTLQFNEDQTLQAFQARGNVVVIQPGRRLAADSARSQNRMQTIVLQGKARMQQEGQFDLTSDRLEVFTDTKRGAVQSEDRQRPMTLSLDLNAARPWRLDAPGIGRLKEQGVPDSVLKKLEPIQGRTFLSQKAFQQAVSERLTPEESERHLSAIANQAKP